MRGRALEKSLDDSQINLMTWNICGLGGGMSLDHGGVSHWRSRLDAIIEKIKQEDPDVLILQEVYDTDLAEALIERLQDDYAHFFTHLGPNVWGMVGGTMVLSKCAVHHFSHTSFKNNDWTLNRGFATLEIKASPENTAPCARIIGTHCIHGDEVLAKNKRAKQIAQIADHVACQTLAIPTVLAGDLNMERDGEEGELLSKHLYHAYQGRAATCTNRLTAQWKEREPCEETIDYISLFKKALFGAQLEECRLVKAFDTSYNTKTALSDHHGLVSVLKI
jgi:endonuclease/exonuclease/phosphatase family metal-dependent hydrolase